MTTIHDEIDWERKMIDRGVERFLAIRDRAVEGERVTETTAGQRLLKTYIMQVAETIGSFMGGSNKTVRPELRVVRNVDPKLVAYMALKSMLVCVYKSNIPYTNICDDIGSKIEDELHFQDLETHHKEYLDEAMRIIESKRTANYSYLRNSILQSAKNNVGYRADYWTRQQRVAVGLAIASLVQSACDLFEVRQDYAPSRGGPRGTSFLTPTAECISWVTEHDEAMSLLFPDRMPMLIQPDDWTGPTDGGYVLPELRHTTPLVIRARLNPQNGMGKYRRAKMDKYLSGVNAIQRTAWRINTRVLAVMQDVWYNNLGVGMPPSEQYEIPACPLEPGAKPETAEQEEAFQRWKSEARAVHAMEAERSALCMLVQRNMRLAQELQDHKEFYYVYRCDFRGRVYAASTGVSPQGPDQSKALLEFSSAEPLGDTGAYWFYVNIANKYGYDKVSYEARVQWVKDNHDVLLRIAGDPIGSRELWGRADKPYQFLACAFEYADHVRLGDAFKSRLPVGLDGSCNGLQHFSAMLRDPRGGAAVNLTPSDKPSDIYQQVADVTTQHLLDIHNKGGEDSVGATNWLKLFKRINPEAPWMDRKWAKAPVMTLPYGSTQQTCTDSIYDVYRDKGGKFFGNAGFRHAIYLSPILWQSIGEVVVAARQAMRWLQKASSQVAKVNGKVDYVSPLGFPVHQRALKTEIVTVATKINGRTQLKVNCVTDEVDLRKIKQWSAPNFVHDFDATHMLMVVNAANAEGVGSFAMIHDDFGCHARHVQRFQEIIREQFVALHSEPALDWLYEQFRAQVPENTVIDPPPSCGALDLSDVLRSPYFFG